MAICHNPCRKGSCTFRMRLVLTVLTVLTGLRGNAIAQTPILVPNPGFEEPGTGGQFALHWTRGAGPGTQATMEIDPAVFHFGAHSLRITDATATAAYKYALVNSDWIAVSPSTTYVLRFFAKGKNVGRFFAGAGFEGAGEYRAALPAGDYDWQQFSVRLTTPASSTRITLQFVADGVCDGVWIDDVTLERSELQLANITETRSAKSYSTWMPRTTGPVAKSLVVADITKESIPVRSALTALQGIVNRKGARLYLLNPTNPQGYDRMWLEWIKQKGYTSQEELLPQALDAIKRFKSEIKGVVVWDPALPGSVNVAWMLAGLRDALPVSPELAAQLKLPVLEDLKGRWKSNVEAMRWVYQKYWAQMNHHLLAWEYPLSDALTSRDYMVQHRVFLFWISGQVEHEVGADPSGETEFVEELLSKTPGNVPVMGWPKYGDTRGVDEYTAVRMLSEFGKWVPGTGYNSNVSVHSAIRPLDAALQVRSDVKAPPSVDPNKAYVSLNIMDSGDGQWYWQFYQRQIWADPLRGSVPTGYGMNPTLLDTLPDVAQYYVENLAPGDSLFGLLYMNVPVYASRFRAEDRERIWNEYVRLFDEYRRKMGMDGIELYNGGSGGPSAPMEYIRRFTTGMKGLNYILADLGRHSDYDPDTASSLVDGVAVFHTGTNFRIWSTSDEVVKRKMESENKWLAEEIVSHLSKRRPTFMSGLAISWSYFPAWMKNLATLLPADVQLVTPADLARLRRAQEGKGTKK